MNNRLWIVVIGTIMGLIHDLQCYRKAVNVAKRDSLPKPEFDWLCMGYHVLQGASAGMGAGVLWTH